MSAGVGPAWIEGRDMHANTASAVTGAVIGALLALVLSLAVLATAGPETHTSVTTGPALITLAGAVAGGLIGTFNP